jgi:hypothetical protein
MQLSTLRAEIAPLFDTSDVALYERQKHLRAVPVLRNAGLAGHSGRDCGPPATAATAAILLLAAMLGQNRYTIGERTGRLWEARCVTPTGNPVERCKTAGALLTLLLQRADIRARLIFCELDHDIPHLKFVFGDPAILTSDRPMSLVEWQQHIDGAVAAGVLAATFYAPFRAVEWKRRFDAAFTAGKMAHISRLPASTLDKVAALIAADQEAERNPQ